MLPNPEADENDYKLPAPSSVAFAQRIENRPPEDKVQQFWSLCKIDNLTVTFGAKDVLIQMPLLAYMNPGKLAAILFHEEAITNQIVDPNYAAELLVQRALTLYNATEEARLTLLMHFNTHARDPLPFFQWLPISMNYLLSVRVRIVKICSHAALNNMSCARKTSVKHEISTFD